MNYFQYALKMEEISKAKTLKAKEKIIRELAETLRNLKVYYRLNSDKIDSIELAYKCITKALSTYNGKKQLPAFITHIVTDTQKGLISYYCTKEILPEFSKIEDTFEYTERVIFPRNSPFIENFAKIVKDNKPSFTARYNISPPPIYSYLTNSVQTRLAGVFETKVVPGILYLEDIKLKLPRDKKYTVIEEVLEKAYAALENTENVHEAVVKAKNTSIDLTNAVISMLEKISAK